MLEGPLDKVFKRARITAAILFLSNSLGTYRFLEDCRLLRAKTNAKSSYCLK